MLAALLSCLVVGIGDGDTLSARCDGVGKTIAIRLAEVDAPEKAQPFGTRSKQNLSALCFGKSAQVRPVSLDRYRRIVAQVSCGGHDAGAEQVRAGMAWVYHRYAQKGSPLYDLERVARAARRGIWTDSEPAAPWEWRRAVWRAPMQRHSTHQAG